MEMNSKILLVLSLFACVALTAAKDQKNKDMVKCKGKDLKFEQYAEHWGPCEKEVKSKSGDQEEEEGDDPKKKWGKMIEIKACMWGRMNIYKDGSINEAEFTKSLEKLYDGEVGTGLSKAVQDAKCYEPNLITNLSTDDHCKSFHGFLKCTMGALKTYCEK